MAASPGGWRRRSVAARVSPSGELVYTRVPWLPVVDDMSRREHEQASDARPETFTDERGVTLTRAGVDRAGRRLAESRTRHASEYFSALRDRLGIPPRAA